VCAHSLGRSCVAAERDSELQHASGRGDQILEDAMMLLADGALTFVDEGLNRRKIGRPLEQKPAETLARRVEPWRVIETPDEREQLGERDAHWARDRTV
jgi:hypothetical protein